MEQPHVKLSGDIEGTYVVEETRPDGRLVVRIGETIPCRETEGYPHGVNATQAFERMRQAASTARAAEERHDDSAAEAAWRRYRLIRDAARDPDELLAEGIALSEQAMRLAGVR